MNRCADCKHWDREGEEWGLTELEERGMRACRAMDSETYPDDARANEGRKAIAVGGDLSSGLYTAAEFGCVLFERKD